MIALEGRVAPQQVSPVQVTKQADVVLVGRAAVSSSSTGYIEEKPLRSRVPSDYGVAQYAGQASTHAKRNWKEIGIVPTTS